jgi:hypothetical protein
MLLANDPAVFSEHRTHNLVAINAISVFVRNIKLQYKHLKVFTLLG